jgi:hypothetical protein
MYSNWVPNKKSAFCLAALLMIAALPGISFSQPEFDLASTEAELQAVETIDEIASRTGPNSVELIEPLTNLGLLYLAAEDYAFAIAAFERAREVVRVNLGLSSFEEAQLLRQIVTTERARDNHAGAWDREQVLLALIRQRDDEQWTAPIFREIADRKLEFIDRYLAGEFPPEIVLGCYYAWPRHDVLGRDLRDSDDCHSGTRSDVVRAVVSDAQTNYAEAVAVHLENENYASTELRDLEMGLVRTSEFIREFNEGRRPRTMAELQDIDLDRVDFSQDPWRRWMEAVVRLANWQLPQTDASVSEDDVSADENSEFAHITTFYRVGRLSLERAFRYEVISGTPLGQVEAVIQIADWELLHSRNGSGLKGYELALDMLLELGVGEAEIDRLFAPTVPVVLPAFATNPLMANETENPGRFIEARFDINRFGQSGNIEILEASDATEAAQDQLVGLIRTSKFRPRIENGQFRRKSIVLVRYHFDE